MRVKYRVTDRNTRETVTLQKNGRPIKEVLDKEIYMVFQDDDGTLNITLY
jgi:hypothetical protein